MLTVQDRWTWCCWVMMMANGVRALPTSSRAWVSDTSVLRKIRSTTIPKSRTLRPTVSAYSLQLVWKQAQTDVDKRADRRTQRHKSDMKWNLPGVIQYLAFARSNELIGGVNILLCFVYDNHGAVDRTVGVVAALQFFVVLTVQFVTPSLFWPNAIIWRREKEDAKISFWMFLNTFQTKYVQSLSSDYQRKR